MCMSDSVRSVVSFVFCCSLCTLINVLSLDITTDRLAKVREAGQLRNLYGVWYE